MRKINTNLNNCPISLIYIDVSCLCFLKAFNPFIKLLMYKIIRIATTTKNLTSLANIENTNKVKEEKHHIYSLLNM